MKHSITIAFCFAALFVAANEKDPVIKTAANKMAEITLTATRNYSDPFNQVILDAIFTDPQGKELRVPGFWAGGNTWKLRYASPVLGEHSFRTVCSETGDKGLQGVEGKVIVGGYTGKNLLYQHGPIKIADDKRHFAYADGKPFFWLGDTWWMGLTKRLQWPEDVKLLAGNRLEKGFNVIQIVAGLYPDMPAFDERGANEAGFPWDTAYTAIRPEYFNTADKRIIYLAETGLVPCIVGAWGYHLPWLGTEKMKKHWRYLIARWGALPVVWCAAGEITMPFYLSKNAAADEVYQKNEWTKVIQYMRETDPFHRLITTHPSRTARASVNDPALLDFDMHQSGHGSVAAEHAALALEGWKTQPVMPVLSGEARYEALEIPLPLPAAAARQAFWAHTINSGLAGHTYGANGIWQVNGRDKPYGNSPGGNNWGTTPWNKAMDLPGSAQVGAGRRLIESLPGWNRFEPRPEWIVGWSGKDISMYAVAGEETALAYILAPGTIKLRLPLADTKYTACWFDPIAGKKLRDFTITTDHAGMVSSASPAGKQDWVLTLRKGKQAAPRKSTL
ncbi:apiosidase-like domain-containing protein [Flavihumibacter profundi]|uniref:apiosidase-like domain-containing protein n=1 Tax=Flavihumibacter profundi TaxID=2716883 RepID=UPI001CC4543C|nr:DUF4038 domain-containing protein [Flavihumibacter profundi]MBZ5855926.1 DUF4038 domain-containing protein [Flavihumibacter profundi]